MVVIFGSDLSLSGERHILTLKWGAAQLNLRLNQPPPNRQTPKMMS
jgi:hypothetical protein